MSSLLRVGVGLLGVGVTFDQIGTLGSRAHHDRPQLRHRDHRLRPCRSATHGPTLELRDADRRGAAAICGASAALAISAVLPRKHVREKDVLFTVVAVTGLSTLAMISYPVLFSVLGFGEQEVGLLIGATIHDVAQVVGAGDAVSEQAGDTATFVKLVRLALLPIVVGGLWILLRHGDGASGAISLPFFLKVEDDSDGECCNVPLHRAGNWAQIACRAAPCDLQRAASTTSATTSLAAATEAQGRSVRPSKAAANHHDPYSYGFRLSVRWQGGEQLHQEACN